MGHRIAPPRFLVFLALLGVGTAAAYRTLALGEAFMVGFDVAATAFLASLFPLLKSVPTDMRQRARDNDANRVMLLILTGVVCIVVLVAVALELSGRPDLPSVALVVATLALAWLFSNTVYALHYAHLWYRSDAGAGDDGGLDFPGCKEPGYWEFVYFAYTLGMTFQTSDVDITTTRLRRVATVHSLAAFVFNLGVLAFTINVLGG